MTLAADERIFLIILIINLVVAFLYLLAGILIVTIQPSADNEMQEKPLCDNRRAYFLRFLSMVLCPVVGPLFFFVGHVCYMLLFWKEANLADVIFSKDRARTHMKADEDRERNIIPLEEAILVNEKKDLRMVMMNVVREDFSSNLSAITLALDSGDSEAAHYAASVLSDELNHFRTRVQKLWIQLQEEDAGQTDCETAMLSYMDGILKQRVFSDEEQRKFVGMLEAAAQSYYDKRPADFTLEWYVEVCLRTLEIKMFEACSKWCGRLAKQFPEELPAYTCRLKLYFAVRDRESFFGTMEELKQSHVVIDSETLELIRIFS